MINRQVFKIAIVIMVIGIHGVVFGGEVTPLCGDSYPSSTEGPGGYTYTLRGVWATAAEAIAARDAYCVSIGGCSRTWNELTSYVVIDGDYWHTADGEDNNTTPRTQNCFAYPKSTTPSTCWGDPANPDGDNDGIPDDQDPYSDNEPFKWVVKKEVKNASGTLLYLEIYTSKGDIFRYGDVDAESECYAGTIDCTINENQVPGNESEWENYAYVKEGDEILGYVTDPETEIALVLGDEAVGNETVVVDGSSGEVEGMTEGDDNAGNTIDTDYLHDVVTNTKAIADNQKVAADYSRQIRDNTGDANRILEQIRDNELTANVNVNVDSNEIAQKIGDEIREINAEDGATIESEGSNIEGDLQDHIDGLEFNGNIESGDIPEENDLPGIFSDFVTDNAVSEALENSGINITDSYCSMDWDYNGKIIEFSICKYQSVLNSMGVILIGLSGLMSLIIVVRG